MKKFLPCFLCLVFLLFGSAFAEIHIDEEAPESWKDKDILVLTAFQMYGNDGALLEVGGKSILIDGGVKGQRFSLEKALAGMGYEGHVDIIYNTHPHDDHIGAVNYMLRFGFTADEFISTFPEDYNDPEQIAAVKLLKQNGIPYHQVQNEETLEIGGASFKFFCFPDGRDPNALSSTVLITFGSSRLLMTADASGGTVRYFHKKYTNGELRAEVMKYPHHGITTVDNEFVEDVAPEFAYITNYTSATPAVDLQLRQRNIKFKHTSYGRIVLKTDGTDWYITQYRGVY